MNLERELMERLEKLKRYLKDEIERAAKVAKREHGLAKLKSEAPGVAIVETELDVESGDLVGVYNYPDAPEPIGFVVKKSSKG